MALDPGNLGDLLDWAQRTPPVVARVAGLAWTAPAVGIRSLGWRNRLVLVLFLSALIVPVVVSRVEPPGALQGGPAYGAGSGAIGLGRACAVELATGVALGLAMGLVLAAARLAGEILGVQAGLSVAGLLDPRSGASGDAEVDPGGLTPLGQLYGLVALAAFLALDGPLRLVGALVESYRVVPLGGLTLTPASATAAFARVDWALGLALRAAAPAALVVALTGLALGLVARAAAGLGLLSLTLPARAALGLMLALVGLATAATCFQGAWSEVLSSIFPGSG